MEQLISTLMYAGLGLVVLTLALLLMEVLTKFSMKKKIAEEGNIALAIVLGSIIASLGMIISAAIH